MRVFATAAVLSFLSHGAHGQQVLIPWNHTWAAMHPMGAMPDVPPGGDADFDTTWFLKEADFAAQYNGPVFGGGLTGVPTTPASYDSRLSQAPFGYGAIDYFGVAGAAFTNFGDNDGNATNGRAANLTTPLGAAPNANRRAAYFRTTFTVPAGSGALLRPRIRYLIDDGAYLYLDGELIVALNMFATSPENLDTYDGNVHAFAAVPENALRSFDLFQTAGSANVVTGARVVKQTLSLAEGEHTLALSVRNNNLTSSDMCMALELTGDTGCILTATAANVTRDDKGTIYVPGDDTFSLTATITQINGGPGWTSDDAAVAAGAYDTATAFGPYPVSGGPKVINFTSAAQPPCMAQMTVPPPGGSFIMTPQTFSRNSQRTLDPADDTFTTTVLVDGRFMTDAWRLGTVSPSPAAANTPAGGTTGTVAAFGPYSLTSLPVTIVLVDATEPISGTLYLNPQSFIGSSTSGGITSPIFSAAPLPAQWEATTGLNPVMTMTNAGGDNWREFRSEVLDLTNVGAADFSMDLVAREVTTDFSNFEDRDAFSAKLIVSDAAGMWEINLVAPFDTDGNGILTGSPEPYDAAADEFNLRREALNVAINNTLRFEAAIPAGATAAQLVVGAKLFPWEEYFHVRNISFRDSETADSDGDGASDAEEALAGTDPEHSASVFRITGLTSSAGNVSATFHTVSGKFYQGYTSTDLRHWTRDGSRAAITGDGNAASWPFFINGAAPARYFRLAVAATNEGFPGALP
jgi:hypothetical protein